MVRLSLPWPPSANTLHAVVHGRKVLSRKGREYADRVLAAVLEQQGVKALRIGGRLTVSIVACPPDRRKRDLSNLLKATEDSLTKAGVWDDDSQIDELRICRGEVVPSGRIEIEIEATT